MEYTIFNPDYLVSVTGGDTATMKEIAGIFAGQIPEFVSEMKDLLSKQKYYELGLLAHKAKGSVTVMGMDEAARMLKEFELAAKAGEKKERYSEFITKFEEDTAIVIDEMNDYLSKAK